MGYLKHILPLVLLIFFHVIASGQYSEDEWEERDGWMPVDRILDLAGVEEATIVADIGSHEGYLSMHLAKRVGPDGKVFAVDIYEHYLEKLRAHAADRGFLNINTVIGTEDSPNLPGKAVDVVLMIDSYHEMDKPGKMLASVRQALKPGGTLVILEKLKAHAKGKSRADQEKSHTLAPGFVIKELKAAGFKVEGLHSDLGNWERDKDKPMWLVVARNQVGGDELK